MGDRGRRRWMMVGVAGVALAAYANVGGAGFVYDDHAVIEGAPLIHSLGGAWSLLTSDTWLGGIQQPSGLYRPLTSLSFAVNWTLTGPNPTAFRAVNVGLHALASVLLFAALRRFGAAAPASFAAAVLFAAHPLHTEAVVWPVGRAELLAAVFFLAAWALHLRREDAHPTTGLGVGALYLLAMSGKESAATLLIVMMIGDALRRASRIVVDSPKRDARWWAVRYGPAAAALVVFILARWMAVGKWTPPGILDVMNPLANIPLVERLAGASSVIGRYFLLMIWPARLSADYSFEAFRPAASFAEAGAWLPAAVLIALLGVAFALRRRHPLAALGLVFPAATFLLTANLLFPIGTIMAERLAYLPSAGFAIVAGSIFSYALGSRSPARRPRRLVAAVLLALIAAAGAARSLARNAVWADDLMLWEATVRAVPGSWWAQFNLAAVHLRRGGGDDRALTALRKALEIRPRSPELHNEIGEILRRRGDLDGAAEEFRREMSVQPSSSRAPFNLGLIHLARGESALAKEIFALAARNDPRNADAVYNVGVLAMQAGSLEEARRSFERALAVSPAAVHARVNLATTCLALGDAVCAREAARLAAAAGLHLPPELAALLR